MTKTAITKTWIAGLVTFAAGIVVALVGVFVMLVYGGTFTQVAGSSNYDFTPNLQAAFWFGVAVIIVGGLAAVVGGIVQLAAWIGALVNSYALPERTWFLIVLIGGLLSFAFAPLGFAAMVAYVAAAPDGAQFRAQPP